MAAEPESGRRRLGVLRHGPALAAIVLVGLLLALLGYGLVHTGTSNTIDTQLSKGDTPTPPDFSLAVLQPGTPGPLLAPTVTRALADGRVSLRELRGVPVVVNFWASWCPPCREEAPRLERAWEQARGRGVLLLGLNQQDLTGDARAFMRGYGTSYPNVRDPQGRVAPKWGVTGLPETFFLNRRGQVVDHVIGAISVQQLSAGIAAARSGHKLGVSQGGARRKVR
jgi:cytochrome c biogenesis protein CcmG, thiol:disulfide interchange protein DsbE